ncbi:MAG: TetR/AcrR family transcriptional regulator [Acidimicrobiia bacterium]
MSPDNPGARRRAVTEADKERRREAILAAAKRVFARKGYHATKISDIARAARISYGSIYWYFDSKDALFDAVIEAEERRLREHIQRALEPGAGNGDVVAHLRDAVRTTFEFFENDRAATRLLFREASGRRVYEHFVDDIEAMVRDAQRRGLVIDAPPRLVATSVVAFIGQLAQRRLTADDGVDAATAADFVVRVLLEGLIPRTGTRLTRQSAHR